MTTGPISRRQRLKSAGAFGILAVLERLAPAYAWASNSGAAQVSQLSGKIIDRTIAGVRRTASRFCGGRERRFPFTN